ncbi:hypothetical protein ONS95_000359 [Cadophora gregata]|uniref:uncharacterized protein n=1 Tax=Cadophora gregata TaxID=51156 RepID=UPI0026DC5FA3|nr:uncharacterized protein ONS95_000359 [Cadophora gregata]KAK0128389.1 hypothetical protein ONS95_000359 [Cadophora gregata]
MRFSSVFVLGVQISSIVALPAHSVRRSQVDTISYPVVSRNVGTSIDVPVKRNKEEKEGSAAAGKAEGAKAEASKEQVAAEPAKVEAGKAEGAKGEAGKEQVAAEPAKVEAGKEAGGEVAAGEGEAAAGEGEAAAGEGEEAKLEGEKELVGAFGTAIPLEGGDIKQDAVFTKSATGAFEFEFQSKAADELTVTENKTPAAPPAGFVAVEPSSFQVALGVSKGAGLTLSKIDYIFDGTNAALAAMDLTQAKIGKLCADTGSFVIEETLGELEFEAEENEVTLNLNKDVTAEGEWGIFLPAAAAGGEAAAGEGEAAAGEGEAAAGEGEAAAGEAAKGEAGKGEAAAGGANKNETEAAKPAEKPAAKPATEEAAGGNATTDVQALIDQLRSGRASVPGFVAPPRR